jgi:hypothetical protein
MNFPSRDEETSLEFPDGLSDRTDWPTSFDKAAEQSFAFDGQPVQLPLVPRATDGKYRRPQGPVNERVLMAEQLGEEHIRVLSELGQDGENNLSLRMAPP